MDELDDRATSYYHTNVHTIDWPRALLARGYPRATLLGAGAEGTVFALGQGEVAKVWRHRTVDGIRRLQAFYADVEAAALPFATPRVRDVRSMHGYAVSFERALVGEPLQPRLRLDDFTIDARAVDTFVVVLHALAGVPGTSAMKAVHVLNEPHPFWSGHTRFAAALSDLALRRSLWRSHVEHFDVLRDRFASQLHDLPIVPDSVIHGDLFGENVLQSPCGAVSAVLDFGFISTAGDPRFDAGVCAAIVNMYGRHARQHREQLTRDFAHTLKYDPEVLVLYQAAYALATGTAFVQDGPDGHFRWSAELLGDPRVRHLLA